MPDLRITVDGLDQLFARLDRITAVNVLEAPMKASVLDLVNYMEEYPATQPSTVSNVTILPPRGGTGPGRAAKVPRREAGLDS